MTHLDENRFSFLFIPVIILFIRFCSGLSSLEAHILPVSLSDSRRPKGERRGGGGETLSKRQDLVYIEKHGSNDNTRI
jgi:hypothetical protein